jgi:protein-disulfide isomerase
MRRFISLVSAALCALSLVVPAFAGDFSPKQKSDIEELVHSYLISHPEILQEMATKLEANQKQAENDTRNATLINKAAEIYHDETDAVIGNPKGDVTLVEFMDYNCGWCKKSMVEMQALLKVDKNVRVVMKEFPIFGAGSEYAAKAALASVKQGKYWQFHQAMFAAESKITPELVDQIAVEQGLDLAKLKTDMQDPAIIANIQKTNILAQTLLFTGTPAFIVDNQVSPGYVPIDTLQNMVVSVRANGGCKIC